MSDSSQKSGKPSQENETPDFNAFMKQFMASFQGPPLPSSPEEETARQTYEALSNSLALHTTFNDKGEPGGQSVGESTFYAEKPTWPEPSATSSAETKGR